MNPFPIMLAVAPATNTVGFAAFNANLGADRYEILSRAWRFGLICPRPRAKDPQFLWQDAYSRLRNALPWQPSHLASSWPGVIGKVEETWVLGTAGMVGYVAGRFGLRPLSISLWRAEQWKGIAPRYTTKEKFLRLFGSGAQRVVENESAETIEAIMIAEFWLTLYHRGKFTWQRQAKQRGRQVESHEQLTSITQGEKLAGSVSNIVNLQGRRLSVLQNESTSSETQQQGTISTSQGAYGKQAGASIAQQGTRSS
jgi:hypothetical protein